MLVVGDGAQVEGATRVAGDGGEDLHGLAGAGFQSIDELGADGDIFGGDGLVHRQVGSHAEAVLAVHGAASLVVDGHRDGYLLFGVGGRRTGDRGGDQVGIELGDGDRVAGPSVVGLVRFDDAVLVVGDGAQVEGATRVAGDGGEDLHGLAGAGFQSIDELGADGDIFGGDGLVHRQVGSHAEAVLAVHGVTPLVADGYRDGYLLFGVGGWRSSDRGGDQIYACRRHWRLWILARVTRLKKGFDLRRGEGSTVDSGLVDDSPQIFVTVAPVRPYKDIKRFKSSWLSELL